jgi:glycine cleavage system H protein
LDLHLRRDDVFGTVEAVKTVSDLFLPVSGKVVEINSYVVNNASYLNDDPYENWIIKIEISDMDDISSLLKRDEYTSLIGV